jgi:hypothetical protein
VRVCVRTTCTARTSEFDREEVAARISHGGMPGVNRPVAPPLIFIKHANDLPHPRSLVS